MCMLKFICNCYFFKKHLVFFKHFKVVYLGKMVKIVICVSIVCLFVCFIVCSFFLSFSLSFFLSFFSLSLFLYLLNNTQITLKKLWLP